MKKKTRDIFYCENCKKLKSRENAMKMWWRGSSNRKYEGPYWCPECVKHKKI